MFESRIRKALKKALLSMT